VNFNYNYFVESPVERRVALKAEYSVSCDQLMLKRMFGKALLEPVLKFKMTELQDICVNGNYHFFFIPYNCF